MAGRLRMRWAVGLAGMLAVVAGSVVSAATQAENDAKRNAIEQGLKSGDKDQIDSAFAQLTLWFQQDSGNAENGLWRLRTLLLPMSDHAFQTLGMIESAKAFKNNKNPYGMGYLYVMEAVCLFQLDKADDATAVLREGAQRDPTHITDDLAADLTKALIAHNRPDEYADTLRKIIIGCADQPPIVEFALRQRIALLNGQDKSTEALADAKSLFNATTMEHTADAISLLDRQLLLPNMNDRTMVSKFRSEQLAGARPPSANVPPTTSSVVLGIKVDAAPFDDALKAMADDSYAESMRHAAMLLVADKPDDALAVAKRALGQATDSKEIRAANDMIARCYKGQDGTIGRANAFIAGIPAPPPTAAPSASKTVRPATRPATRPVDLP